jgi:hypothetical protein
MIKPFAQIRRFHWVSLALLGGHSHDPDTSPKSDQPKLGSFWQSKAALVAGAFLLIGGFFLISEHRRPW